MTESNIGSQSSGDDGRSLSWMKRPFDVPDLIQTAGSMHLFDEKRSPLCLGIAGDSITEIEVVLVMMFLKLCRTHKIFCSSSS
jgi:hypothetical protein